MNERRLSRLANKTNRDENGEKDKGGNIWVKSIQNTL